MIESNPIKVSMFRRFFRNGVWGVFGSGVGRLLNLLAMIFLARRLGIENFGYFGLVQATLSTLGIFAGASLGATATRYVAHMRHTDPARAGRIIGMIWSVTGGLMFIMVVGIIIFSGPLAAGLEMSNGVDLKEAIVVGSGLLAMSTSRGVQDAVLCGLERFREVSILKLVEGVLILLIMPIFASWGGVEGALAGMAIALGLALTVGIWFSTKQLRRAGIHINWTGLRSEMEILVSFSLPSLLSNLIGTPVLWFGIWLLSRQPAGISETAIYNAAYQWYGPLIFVPMILCTIGMPMMVQLWVQHEYSRFLRLFGWINIAGFLLTAIPSVVLIIFRDSIMVFYGKGFLVGQGVLSILVAAAPFHVLSNTAVSALQSMGRAWPTVITSIILAIILLVMSFLLIPIWGAVGLAVSFFSAYAVQALTRIVLVIILVGR